MNKNDEKIMLLRKQIADKQEKLGKISRFSPITNCSFEIDGQRHNINVLDKEKTIQLLVKLNSQLISAIDLDLVEEYNFNGYNINEWISDLKSRLEHLTKLEEEKKLKSLEKKLHTLLSEDKKVSLELEDIEKLLD